MKTIIYTTPDCPECHQLLAQMDAADLPYEERQAAPSVYDLGTERAVKIDGQPIEYVPFVIEENDENQP